MNNKNSHGQKTKVNEQSGLDKYALKIHGMHDDFSSDSEGGESEFDEEYYKYKPGPIIFDPKNIVTIQKIETPPIQFKENQKPKNLNETKIHHTLTDNNLSCKTPVIDRSTISDKNNHGTAISIPGHNLNTTAAQFDQKTNGVSKNKVMVDPIILPPKQTTGSELSPKRNTENVLSIEKHAADAGYLDTIVNISVNKNYQNNSTNEISKNGQQKPPNLLLQPESSSVGPSEEISHSSITPSSVLKGGTSPVVSNDCGGVIVVEDNRQNDETEFFGEYESFWTNFYESICCIGR